MARLELDDVTKTFTDRSGEILAVDELSLTAEDGEFLVIVGPSGCGKSTTLRMIAGLETVTDGRIRLDDRDVTGLRAQERNIAMVFQSYALYPHMTVRQNMRFGLEQSTDLSGAEMDEMVEEIAELLDIPELLDRSPEELSGGQQQRVALGRAIVRDPDVFLLDEPLSNLDAKLRAQTRAELQRLHDDLRTTTVYVTHDQVEAMTMGDRIAILDGGTLQQVGTPMECYYEPANVFVAGFIGEPAMNFFHGTREGATLQFDGFSYELSDAVADEIDQVEEVTLGVRPDDIEIPTGGSGSNDVAATIDVVEPLGNEKNLYLDPTNGDARQEFMAIVDGSRRLRQDQEVPVRLPEERLYLFDATTGEAVKHPDVEVDAEARPISE